ncbi:asparagine synthase (glutamine-hydrolyzing) [Thermodesulfobacteriota bacterium]
MCGIAGYIGKNRINPDLIKRCLDTMVKRGPDARAFYECSPGNGDHVYLLHSRLSIIDLDERANQPYRIGSKIFVFNGELYNYIELRNILEKNGHRFNTASDTEVFLKTLDVYGLEGLDQCEGMWAFALYDEKNGNFTLCRDRFGEKPLYYIKDQTGLYFGSEVKFIFKLINRTLPVDYKHLYRYLINGYKSLYKKKEGFFKDLKELTPGCTLTLDSQGHEVFRKYWTFELNQDEEMRFEESVSGVRERLIQSVKLRLRSDVPLAFCMSGGIDSNSLISIAKKVLDYDVHGFTIINEDERYTEQDMVDHAVKTLDIKHTPVTLSTDDFLTNLRMLVKHHDAPVYTISYYAHWLLMQNIRDHGYKISISGTAADELFSGYYDHHALYLSEIQGDTTLYEASLEKWNKYIKPIVRNPFLQDPEIFVKNPDFRGHIFLKTDELSGYLKTEWHESFDEKKYDTSLFRRRMLNELFFESVPVILHEDDLNAMYFSIENRSPFLDRELFEFSMRIPTPQLIRNGYTKSVLREALRGIVPDVILDNRRKVGFNAPIFSFLDVTQSDVRNQLLDDSPIFQHVRKDMIEHLLDKSTLPNSESKFLFYFLCSKMFLEEFDV